MSKHINLDRVRRIKSAMHKLKREIEDAAEADCNLPEHIDAARHLFGMHNAYWLLRHLQNGVQE